MTNRDGQQFNNDEGAQQEHARAHEQGREARHTTAATTTHRPVSGLCVPHHRGREGLRGMEDEVIGAEGGDEMYANTNGISPTLQ